LEDLLNIEYLTVQRK